ncbi:MAG TPA: hydrogenase formation protein HypD [Phycisphaerae bacterium]|jgi:hydrogenase expression/formation protein HypD|nr:hydrogenase formation protein HypD [Phycisphaerae bacterium]
MKKKTVQSPPVSSPPEAAIAALLARLQSAAAAVGRPVALMEVCGTHTMSAFRSGLHSLLPANVRLLSGPGCPVCVTSQGDIDLMLSLARLPGTALCTYGDMIRVPGQGGSLESARARGADIRIMYSTLEAVECARSNPARQVILCAVGFETTAPATAAAILAAHQLGLKNFSVFASHKRVLPAMLALLESGDVRVDGFLCPGHVSAIIGAEVYRPICERYKLPCVIGGFEDSGMLAAITRLVELIRDRQPELVNEYRDAVSADGNSTAMALLERVFEAVTVPWRALGAIPDSGMALREEFASYDARRRFQLGSPKEREIPGCLCGKVITGAVTPPQCKLFGKACTPINPIGPCMVSSEGTCQAWFKYARLGTGAAGLHGAAGAGAAGGKLKAPVTEAGEVMP